MFLCLLYELATDDAVIQAGRLLELLEKKQWLIKKHGVELAASDLRRLLPGKQISDGIIQLYSKCMTVEEGVKVMDTGFWVQLLVTQRSDQTIQEKKERWQIIHRGTAKV